MLKLLRMVGRSPCTSYTGGGGGFNNTFFAPYNNLAVWSTDRWISNSGEDSYSIYIEPAYAWNYCYRPTSVDITINAPTGWGGATTGVEVQGGGGVSYGFNISSGAAIPYTDTITLTAIPDWPSRDIEIVKAFNFSVTDLEITNIVWNA